jgi:hypothetical protein
LNLPVSALVPSAIGIRGNSATSNLRMNLNVFKALTA